MRTLRLVLAAAVAAAAFGAIGLIVEQWPRAPGAERSSSQARGQDASHQRPDGPRSLAITTRAEPAPSSHPERMRALLLRGRIPVGIITATVLTDEDCAPDVQGVSHCRNALRLPGGDTIEVRHPHRMHDVPCMTPGEIVRVRRART